ncbi:hypothetical protein K9N68_12590 [Kovacikia minuta CCNUW1]|uniref:hypothetical protein n=1 Tax=Kovacikia minuta TaxID=2931930 RepID=UPI001CCB1BD8|nr:hypothetical protein [Kovacikia minuta]UBF28637.1 hypothetical protein K9N68_12590 [Kovacikia minuta CCNUW1]
MEIKRFVLLTALRFSMIWDLVTTFLGTLLILGNFSFVPIGISLVGTLIVGAFNFSTKSIWERRDFQRNDLFIQILLLRIVWVLAICFDFLTSLTCNATYVAYRRLDFGGTSVEFGNVFRNLNGSQAMIVLFVTTLTVVSPMMVGYIRDQDMELWGRGMGCGVWGVGCGGRGGRNVTSSDF